MNHTECDIEEAHRLYDREEEDLLFIDGYDDRNVSVINSQGRGFLIENALKNDRYIPVRLQNLED